MTLYTTIPILPSGINNAGQIVTSAGIWRDGTLTVVRVGNFSTTSIGINNLGQVVGTETDQGSPGTFVSSGFVYSNGTSTLTFNSSVLNDINDSGQRVGTFGGSPTQGYFYSGSTATPLNDPLANAFFGTIPTGINNAAQIVGSYVDSARLSHGFLYSGGTYTTIDDPLGAGGTNITGINNAGQIVGYFTDVNGGVHGFIDTGGVFTTVDEPSATGFTRILGLNEVGQIVGTYVDASGTHGFLGTFVPAPPPDTSADMILRRGDGNYQIYDIGNNAILGSFRLGQVGPDWGFVTLGGFNDGDTSDMLLRNVNTGGLLLYDIANNAITGSFFLGNIGLDWQYAGIAPIHGAGTSDLVLRNVNTGAFQVYDIAGNTLVGSASLGATGLDWQLGGFASYSATGAAGTSDNSTAQLVQAMAGFGAGSGAADGLNAGLVTADPSQQTLLTPPQHV